MNTKELKKIFKNRKTIAGMYHKSKSNLRYKTVLDENTYSFTVPYSKMLPSKQNQFKNYMLAIDLLSWLDVQQDGPN